MSGFYPESITSQVDRLIEVTFGDVFPRDEPILGEKDEDIIAANRDALLMDPSTVVSTLIDNSNELLGISLAVPIEAFDPTRFAESGHTAYVYWTAIREDRRGAGLVGKLQRVLHADLINRGYGSFEEDVMIDNGYAANVITAYTGSVAFIEPHCRWPEVGYQARVGIDLTEPSRLPRYQST